MKQSNNNNNNKMKREMFCALNRFFAVVATRVCVPTEL